MLICCVFSIEFPIGKEVTNELLPLVHCFNLLIPGVRGY